MAVNVSAAQLKSANLVNAVREALQTSRLLPNRLELEITETVLLQSATLALETLHQLRGMGLRISLDDFGTGYSSIGSLRSFPFNRIKIDQSFVRDLAARADSAAIVHAIVDLGCALGMSITAEGVETEDQLRMLRSEACTEVQGFLFGAPVPALGVPAVMARTRRAERIAALAVVSDEQTPCQQYTS